MVPSDRKLDIKIETVCFQNHWYSENRLFFLHEKIYTYLLLNTFICPAIMANNIPKQAKRP